MKRLKRKDDYVISYLLDNGLTEVTILNTKNKIPYTFIHAEYWHPYEIKHMMRDFAHNSPLSYVRLGQKLNELGLCIEGNKDSWNLKEILIAISENIPMNCKAWRSGISNDNRTVKGIYGSRKGYKEYLFKTFLENK
jgi:hypothetical protein